MAVQAQLFADHFQNKNMGSSSNLHQDWVLMSGSSVLDQIQNQNKQLSSSYDYEYQQDQRLLESQQQTMNSTSDYRNLVSSSNSTARHEMIGFPNLTSELERQRLEMDYFLHFQNEKLKAILNEETRRREVIMMHNYESKMKAVIDAKDEVLNAAKSRTKELQTYLSMAEKEAQNWEKKAFETEVMVINLNTQLNHARLSRHEDAESVFNGDDDQKERQKKKMACKMCHVRSSCVLLLPCRHLCCCRFCEGLVMFCPVCETVKNGSLEVYFGPN